ncbi:MAG: hypothetical protein IJ877_01820 [Candidatus Gastranaerophilales bacterium]|nr:hypothetical protein [Candidatus Gastranaerophilales bacterium]
MYKYFKNIAEKSSCSMSGACSVHPVTSALYDVLLYKIREAVFYLVKMKEFNFLDEEAQKECLEKLSLFLINTSLNEKKYLDVINKINKVKNELKNRYIKYCANNELPCEILKTNIEISEKTTITQIVELAQINSINKSKASDKSKQSLFELITLFAKLSAVIISKIKQYEPNYTKYDYEVLRFFALTNAYSIRIEKIKRRIQEFCPVALNLKRKLFEVLEQRYGKKQNAQISLDEFKGHAILVSGDDLNELENILKTVENLQKDINVYTNGSLFLAHFYPYFQNNKFLKGHWGVNDAQYDFSKFEGTILITKNFLQKIDSLYKGDIYSSKVISFSKVNDIKNNDYIPVINSAMKHEGFLKHNKKTQLNISYDLEKINGIINDIIKNPQETVIIAGNLDSKKIFEEYQNKKIVHFSTPLESDIMLNAIEKLRTQNIKTTIFFPHCDLESLYNVFLLLDKNVKIYLSSCSHIIINPHIIEALKDDFNVDIIE